MKIQDQHFHKAAVVAETETLEKLWVQELAALMHPLTTAYTFVASGGVLLDAELVLVDENYPGLMQFLDSFPRQGRAVCLVSTHPDAIPQVLLDGKVDDVLIHPFRRAEVLSKFMLLKQVHLWEEVEKLNRSFVESVQKLEEDVRLAERLQKLRLPQRFPQVKGCQVSTRFLAGSRPGGDHFDLIESKDGTRFSLLLSDSSTYGLASMVLSVLMMGAMKLTIEESASAQAIIQKIHSELQAILSEKDKLSLFFGIFSPVQKTLRYINLGNGLIMRAHAKSNFELLPPQGSPLQKSTQFPLLIEDEALKLDPQDRLILLTDGFAECLGGEDRIRELCSEFRDQDPKTFLNELAFRVKKTLSQEGDLPAQDCSAIVMDFDSQVIRLIK